MSGKKINKNVIQSIIGVVIGSVFLFFTLRNKPLGDIYQTIVNADVLWIILAGILLSALFYARGIRWKLLIENMGYKPKTKDVMYAMVLRYFINSFTPKVGEIMCCTSLSKRANIPLSQNLGIVVTERIYDILVLVIGLITVILIEFKRLKDVLFDTYNYVIKNSDGSGLIAVSITTIILVSSFLIIRHYFKKGAFKKATDFIIEIGKTIRSTFKIKRAGMFIFQTVVIWFILVLMNYCFLRSLSSEITIHSYYFAIVVLFVGAIGWALPSPGGIGTTNFFILHLFLLYDFSEEAGVAYGILSYGLTFLFTLGFGMIILAIHLVWSRSTKNKSIQTDNLN